MLYYLRLPDGTVGDPQPFFWNGVYHLFYMFCHEGTANGSPMAHAVSTDLVHWEMQPNALEPGPCGSPDYAGIASGSVIEKDGTFHFFYTGRNFGPQGQFAYTICHAVSRDLIVWEKDPANPILKLDDRWYTTTLGNDWRDPCVFYHAGERKYWIFITTMVKEPAWMPRRGCIGLAVSDDLTKWDVQPPEWFFHDEKVLECMHPVTPDGQTFLIYSCDGVEYKMLHGVNWETPVDRRLDGGDFYAPGVFYVPSPSNHRYILAGWIKGRLSWGGTLALPRELFVRPDGSLGMKVVPEVIKEFNRLQFDSQVSVNQCLGDISRDAQGIYLEEKTDMAAAIFPDAGPDGMLEVDIIPETPYMTAGIFMRCQNGLNGPGYTLAVEQWPQRLAFRRWEHWCDKSPIHELALPVKPNEPVRLRIFLTRTVMEAFVNDERSISGRLYDSDQGQMGIFVKGGKARFQNIKFFK